MNKLFSLSVAALIALSCVNASFSAKQAHRDIKVTEVDAIIGQWDYDLLTKDGTKIKGFFQVEPSNKVTLSVVGQAYFDKGKDTFSTKNLRGVWTGVMRSDKQKHDYVLTFLMRGNPIHPSKHAELPYHGTINFHQKDEVLDGTFSDHDSREGVDGTIIAHRHQSV